MKRIYQVLQVLVLMGLCQCAWSGPVILTSGNIITGVNDVTVGSETFDVRFVDGSCVTAVAGGCVASSFNMHSTGEAEGALAMFALQTIFEHETNMPAAFGLTGPYLDLDTPDELFFPTILSGVTLQYNTGPNNANNNNIVFDDEFAPTATGSTDLDGTGNNLVFANWTEVPNPAAVPEPGMLLLTGAAIAWMLWARRPSRSSTGLNA